MRVFYWLKSPMFKDSPIFFVHSFLNKVVLKNLVKTCVLCDGDSPRRLCGRQTRNCFALASFKIWFFSHMFPRSRLHRFSCIFYQFHHTNKRIKIGRFHKKIKLIIAIKSKDKFTENTKSNLPKIVLSHPKKGFNKIVII